MTGAVRGREGRLRVTVRGPHGETQKIDAVIDTGFTAFLTLPPLLIDRLHLRWRTSGRGILADGTERLFNIYEATVMWNRKLRSVFVSEAETTPLIGMTLLEGYELNMQIRPGGKVTIRPLADNAKPARRRR